MVVAKLVRKLKSKFKNDKLFENVTDVERIIFIFCWFGKNHKIIVKNFTCKIYFKILFKKGYWTFNFDPR